MVQRRQRRFWGLPGRRPAPSILMGKQPERSCIACRKTIAKAQLLRYVLSPAGEVVLDYNAKLPGRGCYLCADSKCITKVTSERGFNRAFKKNAISPSPDELISAISEKARGVIVSLLSLAQRSRKLSLGAFAVEADIKRGSLLLLLALSDISSSSEKKWKSASASKGLRFLVLPLIDQLHTVFGNKKVVGIKDEGIASRLEIEIERAFMSDPVS